jgi:hypothetical protein
MMHGPARVPVELVYFYSQSGWPRLLPSGRLRSLDGVDSLRLQMMELITPHLPPRVELQVSGLALEGRLRSWNFSRWLKRLRPGSIVIFVRYVAYGLTPEEIDRVRAKAAAVGVDHKDGDMAKIDLSLFDFHIGASNRSHQALTRLLADGVGRQGAFAGLLYQSYDRRLDRLRLAAPDELAAVYLGYPGHTVIPPTLEHSIRVLFVIKEREMRRALAELPAFNFHHAVRSTIASEVNPDLRRQYKPFTKGMIAAACNANVLVNEQVDDAVDFLTRDYPYLIRSNDASAIEDGFRKAREEFGGPEWRRGLKIMQAMKARVAPEALAQQFTDIITRAADQAARGPWRHLQNA